MKIEEQILTIEQAKHLQELGLDMSDAALYWIDIGGMTILPYWIVNKKNDSLIPTYTLQEVLDKLPAAIKHKGKFKLKNIDYTDCRVWYTDYRYGESYFAEEYGESLLEAAYKMLCWVIKKGFLKEK